MRKASLEMVHALAKRDSRIVYIASDPGAGTLASMRHEFPDRFLIEGISEAYMIGMSAGMAMEGFIPYVNTVLRLGLPDKFTHNYGSQESLLIHYGLNADGIAAAVTKFVTRPTAAARPLLVRV